MTRKDFQLIAEAIGQAVADTAQYNQLNTAENIAYAFSQKLQRTNERFDRIRFFKAINAEIEEKDEQIRM